MATEKGYKGTLNSYLVDTQGRKGTTDQFFDRAHNKNQFIPSYQSTYINDWIRVGVSQSIHPTSGSILYPMIDQGSSIWGNSNLAISKTQFKVKNLGNLTCSIEFKYNTANNNDWAMVRTAEDWGRDYQGKSAYLLTYNGGMRHGIYCAGSAPAIWERGAAKHTFAGGYTIGDTIGWMFHSDKVHYHKNGVEVYTSVNDDLGDWTSDYMHLVLSMTGYNDVGGVWRYGTTVTGECKPFSFEEVFKTQFELPMVDMVQNKATSTAAAAMFITGSDTTMFPAWEPYVGNYWFGTSPPSWNGGWGGGSTPGVSASFTGSGAGGIYTWRHPSWLTDPATDIGNYMTGYDFDDFDPGATNNYNQIDAAFYMVSGKQQYAVYAAGVSKAYFLKGSAVLFPSGSKLTAIMTGSNWGGVNYASEAGNVIYWLIKHENEWGQSPNIDMYSTDYYITGRYHMLNPGGEGEISFALASACMFTDLKYGGAV